MRMTRFLLTVYDNLSTSLVGVLLYGDPGYPEGIPNREFFGTFITHE